MQSQSLQEIRASESIVSVGSTAPLAVHEPGPAAHDAVPRWRQVGRYVRDQWSKWRNSESGDRCVRCACVHDLSNCCRSSVIAPCSAFCTDIGDGWLGRFIVRHANFFRLHLFYFAFTCTLFAVIVWGIEQSNPKNKLEFVDALFTAFSSSTFVTSLAGVLIS